MKTLLSSVLLAALALMVGGCFAPPAYSPIERYQQIGRNWDYEGRQGVEDWDHFWLLRPSSRSTVWDVR